MTAAYVPYRLSSEDVLALRRELSRRDEVVPILSDPGFASRIAALGIQQETGGINDELSHFIHDRETGERIPRERLRAQLIQYRGRVGVRIHAQGHPRLELRLGGARELLHPTLSFEGDGAIRELVLFPESLARIAALRGVELVIVRDWALNTVFGGFDPAKPFYETNAWELVHIDTVRYASLLERRQVALLGTHDLASHLSGLKAESWDLLQELGAGTRRRLAGYFGGIARPSLASLVIPYAAGVLLDDLAQPANFGDPGRRFVLDLVMDAVESRVLDPASPGRLLRFPPSHEKLIWLARSRDLDSIRGQAPALLKTLVREIRGAVAIGVPA